MTQQEIVLAIDALERALMSSQLTVEYAGRRVTYASKADIISALTYFQRRQQGGEPGGAAPSSARRTTYAEFERD